jgi:hypothetical protein
MLAAVCLNWIVLSAGVAGASGGPDASSPAVVVRGNTDCPSPSAVSDALVGLLAPPWAPATPDIVEVSRRGLTVAVTLTDGAGHLIAEKSLTETGTCAERAETLAVMVAAWETHLRAGQPIILPRVVATAAASETALPVAQPLPRAEAAIPSSPPAKTRGETASGKISGPSEADLVVTDDNQTAPRAPLALETRAGLLMSVADGTIAPAATCDVSLSRRDARFAIAAGALVVGTHVTTVVPGSATWRRFGGLVDLRSVLRWQTVDLEMHAGAAFTALTIAGESLPLTSGATMFDPGVLIGVRSRFRLGRVSPWIEATAAFWPLTHTLYVDGTATSSDLPSFEALLGGGISFGADR